MKLKNLTLLFTPKSNFLGKLLKSEDFFIVTFDDSFYWSKQFTISDNNELPILILRGLTSGLELFRTTLFILRLSVFISINLELYNGISLLIRRLE